MHDALSVDSARELLDFTGGGLRGGIGEVAAEEQLVGAVAIHNLLVHQRVAYLADEVGMGKTYVALGAMALLRHFQPDLRVLVLAPRENIQRKWIREWTNFVAKIVRVEDLAVKGIGGEPVRALVRADSLVDLISKTSADPDRDFFIRLPSFSLPIWASQDTLAARRRELLKVVPWLPHELLDARDKETYKRNFARAVNCALPEFDLLIVDEGHNLKAGWKDSRGAAIRNTVIGCALAGRPIDDDFAGAFRGYGAKAKRVLFLSATPIEDDFRQLWNQLDLFGFGAEWSELRDNSLDDDARREIVRRLLIRRSAELSSAGRRLTKTEYRTEWRGGGVAEFDEPLDVPDGRQRLAVALIQKKVSELIGSAEHKHSFQVGLLASFESFMQTALSATGKEITATPDGDEEGGGDSAVFHRSAAEVVEMREAPREGVDVDAVNRIAKDHVRRFGKELPHPKMDALAAELSRKFRRGEKSLVFVRRVASVDELQRKLEEEYDEWLLDYLRRSLHTEALQAEIDRQFEAYRNQREGERHRLRAAAEQNRKKSDAERSSVDSFFAWFFRGEGPEDVRSGARIAGQLEDVSGNYVTLLEDNYVADVLGVPVADVVDTLSRLFKQPSSDLLALIGLRATRYISPGRTRRKEQFRAVQRASLELLASHESAVAADAQIVLDLLFNHDRVVGGGGRIADGARRWLGEETLFSALKKRPTLRQALWPESTAPTSIERLKERELRRELFSSMIRKGHPIIDLFILIANRIGTLKLRAREPEYESSLVTELLDLLERQRAEHAGEFHSYFELSEAAASFDLILRLNVPDLEREGIQRASRLLGSLVRAQRPIGGMAGQVNTELVRQFRMPGYPLVLVTTDLLKEGEDLHTFCANVVHYGIAWMPSELEQRVGRVDRVGSLTERRLSKLSADPTPVDKLQVYYPHLRDTVEVLQVRRVYERLNRFLRIMHEGLGAADREASRVDVLRESLRDLGEIPAITEPLKSAYRVTSPMLRGKRKPLRALANEAHQLRLTFASLVKDLDAVGATHLSLVGSNRIIGQFTVGSRVQPFVLLLRSIHGHGLLRCVSPVGRIDTNKWHDQHAERLKRAPFVRVSLERNDQFGAYDVAIEGDVIFGGPAAKGRATKLVIAAVTTADRLELALLGHDRQLHEVESDFSREPDVER